MLELQKLIAKIYYRLKLLLKQRVWRKFPYNIPDLGRWLLYKRLILLELFFFLLTFLQFLIYADIIRIRRIICFIG